MVNRLKNALWLIVGVVVAVWALTSLMGLVQAGGMDPPGPPGSTLKPLFEIEPRTAIWQPDDPTGFPIIISQPGSYYLGRNITGVANKDGIHIRADNVTLDLNGFTVQGVEGSFNGITVPKEASPAVYNLSIFNGTIRDWGNAGIGASDPNGEADNSRLADLILDGNGGPGVRVGSGSTITRVTALGNGQAGIQATGYTIVVDSQASSNTGDGILAASSTLDRVRAFDNGGDGIAVFDNSVVTNCVSKDNRYRGMVVSDSIVSNCSVQHNLYYGIYVGQVSTIVGNLIFNNGAAGYGGAGIYVNTGGNRIEGNHLVANFDRGIDVDGNANIIIKNSANGNGANPALHDYDITGTNVVGQIIDMTGGGTITADPWANFRH